MSFLAIFFFTSPFLNYDLSFDIQKPSHVTNIHWKFHDFFLSGLEAIKVFHFTIRSEDGVWISKNVLSQPQNGRCVQNTPSSDRTVKCKTFIAPKPLGKKLWNLQWKLVTCDGFCMSKLRSWYRKGEGKTKYWKKTHI